MKELKKVHSTLNMADTQEQNQELLQRDLNDLTYKRQEALEQAKAALTLVVEMSE